MDGKELAPAKNELSHASPERGNLRQSGPKKEGRKGTGQQKRWEVRGRGETERGPSPQKGSTMPGGGGRKWKPKQPLTAATNQKGGFNRFRAVFFTLNREYGKKDKEGRTHAKGGLGDSPVPNAEERKKPLRRV